MGSNEQNLYSAAARSVHGTGEIVVEGRESLPVSAPSSLGGSGQGYDVEQLQAASVAACLHQAVVIAATEIGADPAGSEVGAHVRLRTGADGHYRFHVRAEVTLPQVSDSSRATVIEHALRICPVADQLDEKPQ
jgi:osmotically inducible protein OsmC